MKKGQALNNQRFERYFMAEIEIVDATVVDIVGEFQLIVRIGNELHRVNFALDGTMRSKEKLEPNTKNAKCTGGCMMKKFLVKMDGSKSRIFRPKDATIFGERNDGIIIEGETQEEAVEKWESGLLPGNRYNIFYLKITEVAK